MYYYPTMSAPNITVSILDRENKPYTDTVLFIPTPCMVCRKTFLYDDLAYALGYPFHCAVHEKCAPFFPFDEKRWPHPKPMSAYVKK